MMWLSFLMRKGSIARKGWHVVVVCFVRKSIECSMNVDHQICTKTNISKYAKKIHMG